MKVINVQLNKPELVNRTLSPQTLSIKRARYYRDYVDILAAMLKALSHHVFSVHRDIITYSPRTINHTQIQRYLPYLIRRNMVIELTKGWAYRFVRGKLRFNDERIQQLYLKSHPSQVRNKSSRLLIVTEKGRYFLNLYNELEKLLEC